MADSGIIKAASFQTRAIRDKDGAVVLYDIYVEIPGSGLRWIGSRRTPEMCREAFRAYAGFQKRPPSDSKGATRG